MEAKGIRQIAKNREATHEYFVLEDFEAGIELSGTEVKSIRKGNVSLKDAWCTVKDGELWVRHMHIAPYEKGNLFNKDPLRVRKLLLHKRQITKLFTKTQEKGFALIPLEAYFLKGRVKIEIGLARGKKLYDKRESLKQKASDRDNEREEKGRMR